MDVVALYMIWKCTQDRKIDLQKRFQEEPDLYTAANIVMRLARRILKHKNYKVYFDNYYTSLPLLDYLLKNFISLLGTVQEISHKI